MRHRSFVSDLVPFFKGLFTKFHFFHYVFACQTWSWHFLATVSNWNDFSVTFFFIHDVFPFIRFIVLFPFCHFSFFFIFFVLLFKKKRQTLGNSLQSIAISNNLAICCSCCCCCCCILIQWKGSFYIYFLYSAKKKKKKKIVY